VSLPGRGRRHRPGGPHRGPRRRPPGGGLRCDRPTRRRGRCRRGPAVPGPLPRPARRLRGTRAVRGRGRGLQPVARGPRPTTGHARPGQPRLYHLRPHAGGGSIRSRKVHPMSTNIEELNPGLKDFGRYEYGWSDSDAAGSSAKRGLNKAVVEDISERKSEPEWMRERRLKALRLFDKKPMPTWGSDLSGVDFQNIKYFVKSTENQASSWEDLPEDIRTTYDRLGIPEAEKQQLVAGVAAQYE